MASEVFYFKEDDIPDFVYGQEGLWSILRRALREGRVARIVYLDSENERTEREILPEVLFRAGYGVWYVAARESDPEVRFLLARGADCHVLDAGKETPFSYVQGKSRDACEGDPFEGIFQFFLDHFLDRQRVFLYLPSTVCRSVVGDNDAIAFERDKRRIFDCHIYKSSSATVFQKRRPFRVSRIKSFP